MPPDPWFPKARPIMIALILVTTSLAGCLGDDATLEEVSSSTESLGTVYTSTWHVQDLVQNIAGDKVDVQLLAPSNIQSTIMSQQAQICFTFVMRTYSSITASDLKHG